MMGRKKWVFLSLALVCVLALSFALFSGGQGANTLPTGKKMSANLRLLCAAYNDFGVQKLNQISAAQLKLAKAGSPTREKQARIMLLQKLVGTQASGKEVNGNFKGSDVRGMDRITSSDLQERWGNPAFDVAGGFITAASDPRSLESNYLKIRKSWQAGDNWKAFCEFAIFKAEEIVSPSEVHFLDLLPQPQPDNDLGSASTGAPRLRVGTPGNWDPNKGYTGHNVIVGDVDTGIDWTHGDFIGPDGSSRILYLWDTTVNTAGKDPETLFGMTGFDYGTVWTQAEINAGLCTEYDGLSSELSNGGVYSGHGTHTCGTAAGNGGATGKYTGMAPNADIIFVKGLDRMGVEFVFEMAQRLGRPAVVNNSWGISWAQYGPYYGYTYLFPGDGSDANSQYFAYVMSAYPYGKVIVKSAGNNGMWHTYVDHSGQYGWAMYDGSLHMGGQSYYGKPPAVHTYHRIDHSFGYGMRREYSDMMIRSNVPVQVKVKFLSTGDTFTMRTGEWGEIPGAPDLNYNNTWFDLDQGRDPYNGEYMGVIWFDAEPLVYGPTDFFPEGDWTINVTPLTPGKTAKYDLWMYSRRTWWNNSGHTVSSSFYDSCYRRYSSHDEYQLDWAASPHAITTGAWTTRNEWLGADGLMHYPWAPYNLEPRKNTITYFSSPGPARDGRMKPDIAAPGAIIMSSLARTAGSRLPSSTVSPLSLANKDPDLEHQWMWGTSMAAPHSTGAIALYLQKYPMRTLNNVRTFLTTSAKHDIFTQAVGRNGFGAGKLNVLTLQGN